MKIILLLVLFLFPLFAESSQQYDTSKLNPCLNNLFSRLVKKENLVGETHKCKLTLKYANDKWLLFNDGYVRLDSSTRYSFLKFTKNTKFPTNLNNHKQLTVTFKVIATNVSLNSNAWPGLEVQLIDIHPAKINKD